MVWDEALEYCLPLFMILLPPRVLWSQMFGAQVREGGCWNPLFTRPFNDWDMAEVSNFLLRLSGGESATRCRGQGGLA